jgi:simple sugar transport system substrate-binding protein/basic membrane protein A
MRISLPAPPKAVAALLVAASLLAAPAMARADDLKAAMLLPGSANDQSWNALGYSGLMKIKSLGIAVAYSENVPDSDDAAAMSDYARQGYKIILGHSGRFLSAAQQVGPDNPDIQFIVGGGAGGQAPNVMSIDYNNAQFGCQLGVLAARMSKTGKVGGVYGLEGLPNIVAQAGGFRLCAKKINPAIVVTIVYVKDMEDAAAAKEAALSLIADGADVLTGKLNAAQNGLVEAAKEKDVYVTARSLESIKTAPKQVLTALLEHWDDMYGAAAAQVKAGKLSGSFVQYGYATAKSTTGAQLQYGDGELNPVVPADVVAEIMDMQAKFAAGSMSIVPTPEDAKGGS